MSWQSALQTILHAAHDALERDGVQWAVAGSTATALQGCETSPKDIEILTMKPEAVVRFAELLSAFAAAECEVESPAVGPWRSTKDVPVFVGSYWGLDWHFACWDLEDFEVEVVHIVAPDGHPAFRDSDGVWDCDPRIWPHVRRVPFAGYEVPVVPLEIQLETNMVRGQTMRGESLEGRISEIIRVLKENGYDRALLEWSLRSEHLRAFDKRMQEG
jgi:hypothetical protein